PRSTAFLPDGTRAFTTAENDHAIYAIDAAARTLIDRVPLSGATWKRMGVAASPDGSRIFITPGRGGALVVFDPAARREVAAIAVGDRPWGRAAAPERHNLDTGHGTCT